jgi:hypothetical protein
VCVSGAVRVLASRVSTATRSNRNITYSLTHSLTHLPEWKKQGMEESVESVN